MCRCEVVHGGSGGISKSSVEYFMLQCVTRSTVCAMFHLGRVAHQHLQLPLPNVDRRLHLLNVLLRSIKHLLPLR